MEILQYSIPLLLLKVSLFLILVLRINPNIMQSIVDNYKDKVYFVQVGNRFVLHQIKGIMNIIMIATIPELLIMYLCIKVSFFIEYALDKFG